LFYTLSIKHHHPISTRNLVIITTTTFLCLFTLAILYTYFQPQIILVPHHNIVADTRAQLFNKTKKLRLVTKKIIIIGPDHFSKYQNSITYSDNGWHLSNGDLSSDTQFISHFPDTYIKDNSVIKNDHTIYNLLPDIKTNWPDALITSILIGQKYNFDYLITLHDILKRNCRSDCLIIASVDFSHYLPASLAHVHDQKTIRALSNLDFLDIKSSEVDSPQTLYLINALASTSGQKYSQFAHTNSGHISNNPDVETTTHLFASYSRSLLPSSKNKTTTFTYLPSSFSLDQNKTTVGERFFYGVDEIKVQNILPQINQTLPPDFVVSGYSTPGKLVVSYFPINISGFKFTFDRGESKTKRINQFFDQVSSDNSQKDFFWHTITYRLHQ
jgi:MEMO1 family protein